MKPYPNHAELMHLLTQYATGDVSLDILRTRLDTSEMTAAIAALVGQTLTVGPHADQITVGNITHANNIAIGAGAIALEIGSFVLHLPPPPTVAFQVPHRALGDAFVGRDQALERLAMLLLDGNTAAITPAVTGMGGIGKTQVATELAHRYRSHFPGGVFWLSMDVPTSVRGLIAACAGPGGLNLANYATLDFEDRVAATRAAWQESVVRLLVFDNLEDPTLLDEWRPTSNGCRVLITSRGATWPSYSGVQTVPLAPLDTDPALMLLLSGRARRLGTTVATFLADSQLHTAAKAIVTELGGLPLALALAAAFLEQNRLTTLDRYLAQIQAEAIKHRSLNAELRSALPTSHSTSIIATFAVSQQQLNPTDDTDVLAIQLWQRAAHFAAEPIPTRLLLRVADLDPDNETDQEQAQLALDRLSALGLIEERLESYALHQLLAAYTRSIASDVEQDRSKVVGVMITECSAINQAGLPLRGVPYLPHLSLLAKREEQTEQQATLLMNLGYLLNAQGDFTAALPLYQRALAIYETTLGPQHHSTATSLNNLAGLYYAMGNYAEALPLYQRALAIRETVLGPQHPDTAASLNNLAELYESTGNYAEALPLYQRALVIQETVLGPQHPSTAASLNNLAELYRTTGNYAEALPLYQRALAMREAVLGPQHPSTAASLNNLALLYESTGNYAEELPLYQRALAIYETTLGPQHHSTATSLNNLAGLYYAMGNYAEALPLYQRALAIRETVLSPQHPDTAASLNNLAELYRTTGNYAEALPLYQRALAIQETALGPQHPSTAASLNNLAELYRTTGNYAEALPLYQRALVIKETVLGPQHPSTAASLNNLAGLYESMGDYAEALPLYQRALAICEAILGPQHPSTAASLNNLAELYRTTGNYAEALPLYQRALAIQETALGPQHPTTATSLNNLAGLYKSMGNYAEALPLHERALAMREAVLGSQHPSTATSLNNLAGLYESMGNYAEALPLYERALAICETTLGLQHSTTRTIQSNLHLLRAAMEQLRTKSPNTLLVLLERAKRWIVTKGLR